MRDPWARAAFAVAAAVTVLRAVGAARLPLTGDEAYYWEWSRHLAFGYVDHPPAVAFAIAAGTVFGSSVFAIRAIFVACGAVAAWAVFAATARFTDGDALAAAAASTAVTLAPLLCVLFGSASPDGPFLCSWALLLWAYAELDARPAWPRAVALGAAAGAAMLSRIFGFAAVLALGVTAVRDRRVRRETIVATCVALLVAAPFIAWNATHSWATFTFALVSRHGSHGFSPMRVVTFLAEQAIAYSPGLFVAAVFAFARERCAFMWYAIAPLGLAFLLLAFFEPVEPYWTAFIYVTACVSLGAGFSRASERARRGWLLAAIPPAAILTAAVFAATIFPAQVYSMLHIRLANTGPFEVFTFEPLAKSVARIARERQAIVVTDGYGFSSVLDYYGGLPPVIIGYDPQGSEARRWSTGALLDGRNALFVDKEPLSTRPDFGRRLAESCARVEPLPDLNVASVPGVPDRRYYLTLCRDARPNALVRLRWLDGS
ncbi:MAG: glycosyltransferase family 39 protein [Candidatus Eremiobacteraeota bacterium]|nr:glycosyltransferase family 39 protein [Candidatus Eremiobacteraeota bacterium]